MTLNFAIQQAFCITIHHLVSMQATMVSNIGVDIGCDIPKPFDWVTDE